jgi:WD40 repeat protein
MARITGFVWSPNSKLIAGCGSDGCVMVWNATTGSIFTVLEGMWASEKMMLLPHLSSAFTCARGAAETQI